MSSTTWDDDVPLPSDVSGALRSCAARLGPFADRVRWFDTVGSTNDLAGRAASAGAPHGTTIAADTQTSGRGRLGRSWFSPPGGGLYVSVVLRPADLGRAAAASGAMVTLTTGVALAEGIERATGLLPEIKWPNDLVIGSRKLCGVLAEASTAGGEVQFVIVGFGINLQPSAYPPDIAGRATSIEAELSRPVDRGLLLAECLASLAWRFAELKAGGFFAILDRWRGLAPSAQGRRVEVMVEGEWRPAVTAGVDTDGALLADVGGRVQRVVAGEIRWQ